MKKNTTTTTTKNESMIVAAASYCNRVKSNGQSISQSAFKTMIDQLLPKKRVVDCNKATTKTDKKIDYSYKNIYFFANSFTDNRIIPIVSKFIGNLCNSLDIDIKLDVCQDMYSFILTEYTNLLKQYRSFNVELLGKNRKPLNFKRFLYAKLYRLKREKISYYMNSTTLNRQDKSIQKALNVFNHNYTNLDNIYNGSIDYVKYTYAKNSWNYSKEIKHKQLYSNNLKKTVKAITSHYYSTIDNSTISDSYIDNYQVFGSITEKLQFLENMEIERQLSQSNEQVIIDRQSELDLINFLRFTKGFSYSNISKYIELKTGKKYHVQTIVYKCKQAKLTNKPKPIKKAI